ncbi:MAG TPA: YqgE/AlgH family protein [Steroidobacteraceae bacterium]|jgi:putative transcriptional regulator
MRSGFSILRNAAALCACVLLLAAPCSRSAEDKPLTAILLVARTELPDSDFAGSVVLAMNHLGIAPTGIILNRPTRVAVAELFPDLKAIARLHDKVYFGGPVEPMSIWFLFRAAKPPHRAIRAFDDVFLSGDRDLLLQLLGRDKPMGDLRIYVGHAGWAPGQLEAEIDRGDWTLKRAYADAIFNGKSDRPWPAPQIAPPPTI